MSKELTEKWKNGELEEGLYYIEAGNEHDICVIRNRYCPVLFSPYSEENAFEPEFTPVEPVPTYEEYQDILQQNVNQESAIETYIEQIKELEERLADAEHILDEMGLADRWLIDDYFEKWGVK